MAALTLCKDFYSLCQLQNVTAVESASVRAFRDMKLYKAPPVYMPSTPARTVALDQGTIGIKSS